jgi:hypothetical protein
VKPGGTWLEALGVWRNHGGNWTKVHGGTGGGFTQFTITGFSPASPLYKTRVGTGVIGSGTMTVQLANGSGSFTYSWSVVANNVGGSFSGGTTSASALFNSGSQAAPNTGQTTLRCTVTDTGDGNRQQTADIVIDWEWA